MNFIEKQASRELTQALIEANCAEFNLEVRKLLDLLESGVIDEYATVTRLLELRQALAIANQRLVRTHQQN
jgi:hypothetical protein